MAEMILYTGPMFSSKTTKLLMQADKRYYQKKKIIAFKSALDDRYSTEGEIVSHNLGKIPAFLVKVGNEIIEKIASCNEDIDCVIIDELFLIEGGANACLELYKKGYNVIIASIDLNFAGIPFEEVEKIMPYCTRIIKCKAVCPICGDDARYTHRKTDDKSEILVGADDIYEPRCQLHFKYMKA
jgi:thymidine kinase